MSCVVFVGRCKTLLFGVNLDAYSASHTPFRLVPRLVTLCIEAIEAKGLASPAAEGVYRVSAKLGTLQHLVLEIEKDEELFAFPPGTDIHIPAGILKLYLRQLPLPLCAMHVTDRIALSYAMLGAVAKTDHKSPLTRVKGTDEIARKESLASLSKRLRRLSPPHAATLKVVIQHLARVAQHAPTTRMNESNLALLLTSAIIGDIAADENGGTTDLLSQTGKVSQLFHRILFLLNARPQDCVLETIIKYHETLFDGIAAESSEEMKRRSGRQSALSHNEDDEEFPLRRTTEDPARAASTRRSFSLKRGDPRPTSPALRVITPPARPSQPAVEDPFENVSASCFTFLSHCGLTHTLNSEQYSRFDTAEVASASQAALIGSGSTKAQSPQLPPGAREN